MLKYETLDAEGGAVEIAPGQPFRTFWVLEGDEYEVFEVNHPWTDLDVYGPDDFARYRVVVTEVADPPPPVPASVSILRAQLVLDATGRLDAIEAYMANPATPRAHKIFWAKTDQIWRDSEVLAVIAGIFGLTDEDLDGLFLAAAALTL